MVTLPVERSMNALEMTLGLFPSTASKYCSEAPDGAGKKADASVPAIAAPVVCER